jgi:hypothetical protein
MPDHPQAELARQTLADYAAFLKTQLDHESQREDADEDSLEELEEHYQEVLQEQKTLSPAVIEKALSVYAPFLQGML